MKFFITPCTMRFALLACAWMGAMGFSAVQAQESSLFHRPISYTQAGAVPFASANRGSADVLPTPTGSNAPMLATGPVPMSGVPLPPGMFQDGVGLQSSWGYMPPPPPRTLKIHDIISIRVEEASTSLALGNTTSRKTTSYDAVIKDWIRLVGIDTLKPSPQSNGDPRAQINQNEVYRGDSTMRTSESFTTNIAAEIVDIRPNGLIVLNASKTITNNDNSFEITLTGTCRSQDIDPNNVVLSRNLIYSHINKQDRGHVRDGYSRGWLTKLMARIKPF